MLAREIVAVIDMNRYQLVFVKILVLDKITKCTSFVYEILCYF